MGGFAMRSGVRWLVMVTCVAGISGSAFAQGRSRSDTSSDASSALKSSGGLFDGTAQERRSFATIHAQYGYTWYTGYGYGPGIGARYAMPILKEGFLPEVNDSVEFEAGVDLSFAFGMNLAIPLGGMWTFHLMPAIDLYLKIAVGPELYFGSTFTPGFYFDGGVGGIYKMDAFFVRLEGTSRASRLGIGWMF
jgi:hypothetical protein